MYQLLLLPLLPWKQMNMVMYDYKIYCTNHVIFSTDSRSKLFLKNITKLVNCNIMNLF